MGKNCAIPGCPNEKYCGKYLKGFGFPQDEELKKRWIEIIQLNCPTWVQTKYPRFCSLHFDKNDIMDGKNNKLQYKAVPVYFNVDLKSEEFPKREKISSLIRQMNQNQLLYSSDSECEYQIVVKVHKKPRKKNVAGGGKLHCVYCNMKKNFAEDMMAHLRTVHGVIADTITPQTFENLENQVLEDDESKSQMCSECGLVFKSIWDAINHMQVSHLGRAPLEIEEMDVETGVMVEQVEEVFVQNVKQEAKHEYVIIEPAPLRAQKIKVELEPDTEGLIEENVRTTFKCKLCSLDFMSMDEIKMHIAKSHSAPQTSKVLEDSDEEPPEAYEPTCYLCDSSFSSLAKMRKHIRNVHETEEYYFCSHCTGTFLSLDMYEDHECLVEETMDA